MAAVLGGLHDVPLPWVRAVWRWHHIDAILAVWNGSIKHDFVAAIDPIDLACHPPPRGHLPEITRGGPPCGGAACARAPASSIRHGS